LWGFNHMGDVDNMEDIVYNQFDMKIWVWKWGTPQKRQL
jgi:hypothetical protein